MFASEPEDPRVLEEPAHDRPHPNVLGQTWHTGSEAAPSPDHQVDGGTTFRSPVEGVDHLGVGQPVGLEHDAAGRAGPSFGIDGGDHLATGRNG